MPTLLKDVAVGSIVKIKESGVPTEFYVAKHDYEPELNGEGRTLLARKTYATTMKWSASNGNEYFLSDVDVWLTRNYAPVLDSSIRALIGATKFLYTTDNSGAYKTETLARSVFLLSATEFGKTADVVEGTALPIALELEYLVYDNGSRANQWTRTPDTSATTKVCYINTSGGVTEDTASSFSAAVRPVFTVPADDLWVLEDGELSTNKVSLSGENEDLGVVDGVVSFTYTLNTLRGAGAAVTETLYGKTLRACDVADGEEQTVVVNTADLPDGKHQLRIVALCDAGGTAERVFKFEVKPVAIRSGGTVQEFQDAGAEPVYPLNRARNVITEEGRSLQALIDDPPEIYKAGDVRMSTAAGLGEAWLLCNGDSVLHREYPELSEVLMANASVSVKSLRSKTYAHKTTISHTPVYGVLNGRAFMLCCANNSYYDTVVVAERGKDFETHAVTGLEQANANGVVRYTGGKYFYLPDNTFATHSNHTASGYTQQNIYVSDDLFSWRAQKVTTAYPALLYGAGTDYSLTWHDIVLLEDGRVFAVAAYYISSGNSTIFGWGFGDSLESEINFVGCTSGSGERSCIKAYYDAGKINIPHYLGSTTQFVVFDPETVTHCIYKATDRGLSGRLLFHSGYYMAATSSHLIYSEDLRDWREIEFGVSVGSQPAFTCDLDSSCVVNYGSHARILATGVVSPDVKMCLLDFDSGVATELTGVARPSTYPAMGVGVSADGLSVLGYNKGSSSTTPVTYTHTLAVDEYDGLQAYKLPTISVDSGYAYIKVKEKDE